MYVGSLVQFLTKALDFEPGVHLFNYADKPDMTVKELVDHVRAELSITSRFSKLPYLPGLIGGYFFDTVSRLTGKKFPISSIRIRKFCATTTVSTPMLESIKFTASYSLKEGLKRMIDASEEFKNRQRAFVFGGCRTHALL